MVLGRVLRLWKLLLVCSFTVSFMYVGYVQFGGTLAVTDLTPPPPPEDPVTVVAVLCAKPGSSVAGPDTIISGVSKYLRQLKVLVKSLLLSEYEHQRQRQLQWQRQVEDDNSLEKTPPQPPPLELIIFSDNHVIWKEVERWLYAPGEISYDYLKLVKVKFDRVSYPKEFAHLKQLVYPCTTFRLFLGQALPAHDSILYVDTDVIFMKHARVVASEAHRFNSSQWCGMGPDWYHELPDSVPFYGAQGLNAGVGVYKLSRMRASDFLQEIPSIQKEHEVKLRGGGDQGFLNIYFHNRPEEVRQLSCGANYIPLHCIKSPLCGGVLSEAGAKTGGVAIVHGCWQAFYKNTPESQFSILFEEYDKLKLSTALNDSEVIEFRQMLRKRLEENRERVLTVPPSSDAWYETGCAKNEHFIQNLFRD